MAKNKSTYHYYVWVVMVFALIVIAAGAYTRLKDAGLGCPDWPVCYGHIAVPETQAQLVNVAKQFPGQTVEPQKAWIEMIHRYIAGTLGLLVFILAGIGIWRRKQLNLPLWLPGLLVLVVFFQAALGMWTVTLKLMPLVVMGHLLGGFTLLSLLWLTVLRSGGYFYGPGELPLIKLRGLALFGLIVVICQIILGGWTSANYAALACPGLPFCHGWTNHSWHFASAFQWWQPFENLTHAAKATIQMCHRIGAVVTAVTLLYIGIYILRKVSAGSIRNIGVFMLSFLAAQLFLGVMNITLRLPIDIAVAHNLFAAILLLTMIALNHAVVINQPDSRAL